jgi:glucokinase
MGSKIVLGADIGGTHITTALVNISLGAAIAQTRFRTEIDANGTVEHIIAGWSNAIQQSWAKAGISNSPVGIAMPGPFDYENGICLIKEQKKYQSLYGRDIKVLLANSLDIQPAQVRFINDACSFLKGELLGGSVKGMRKAIGVTLGTGLGSAYYENGTLTDADLWKMPFRSGIAEDYLSTRWFVKECKERRFR